LLFCFNRTPKPSFHGFIPPLILVYLMWLEVSKWIRGLYRNKLYMELVSKMGSIESTNKLQMELVRDITRVTSMPQDEQVPYGAYFADGIDSIYKQAPYGACL
ncbi:MAG: hypothetical protein ACE3L7_15415, partial [Candidatus Pristimantibacillus sp.]